MESIRKERKKRTEHSREHGYVYTLTHDPVLCKNPGGLCQYLPQGHVSVKIGGTRHHPERRLSHFQRWEGGAYCLALIAAVPVSFPFKTEHAIHVVYQNLRIGHLTDWFLYDAESMEKFFHFASWVGDHRTMALRGNFPVAVVSQVTKSYQAWLAQETVPGRLRRLRLEHDWTGADMATRMGVTIGTIMMIERYRKTNVHDPLLEKAAKVLGVSMQYLLEGVEYKKRRPAGPALSSVTLDQTR